MRFVSCVAFLSPMTTYRLVESPLLTSMTLPMVAVLSDGGIPLTGRPLPSRLRKFRSEPGSKRESHCELTVTGATESRPRAYSGLGVCPLPLGILCLRPLEIRNTSPSWDLTRALPRTVRAAGSWATQVCGFPEMSQENHWSE